MTLMASFMIQDSYTPESWAAQIANPSDRLATVAEMLAPTGIAFEHYWYSFGDYDFVIIVEGPGNVEAAAAVLSAFAGGAAIKLKTTPLLTVAQTITALEKAGNVQYRPPTVG
jgi:uncharacterized protein with GYD domain